MPFGHSRSAQSPPIHPFEHEHLNEGEFEQTPWPLHAVSPGQAVIETSLNPQSPRVPAFPRPSLVAYPG